MEPNKKTAKEMKVDTSETCASGEALADPGNVVITGGDHTKTAEAEMGLTTKVDARAASAVTHDTLKVKTKKTRRHGKAKRDRLAKQKGTAVDGGAVSTTPSLKRPKGPDDTPPSTERSLKRHKPFDNGLTTAQRTNPLTLVVVSADYPEVALTPADLERVRWAAWARMETSPPEQWARFDDSFCRGGAIIIIASDNASKQWFLAEAVLTEVGENLKVGGVELLQRYQRATVWFPTKKAGERPVAVLERLGHFNPTLKTAAWKIYADVEGKGKEGEAGEEGRTLIVGIPESLVAAVTALKCKPVYVLGKVTIHLGGHGRENATEGPDPDAPAATPPQSTGEEMETQ